MPSHLTRHIFRRIIANEPILHRGCLRRQAYGTARRPSNPMRNCTYRNGSISVARHQRRTMFNLNMFGWKKEATKDAELEPGIEDLMFLAKVQRMNARLPPPEDVGRAFSALIDFKMAKKRPLSDSQAQLALQAYRFCVAHEMERDGCSRKLITSATWRRATAVLRWTDMEPPSQAHIELASELREYPGPTNRAAHSGATRAYVKLLCASGQAVKARDVVSAFQDARPPPQAVPVPPPEMQEFSLDNPDSADAAEDFDSAVTGLGQLYNELLIGFAKADDETRLLEVLETFKRKGWHVFQLDVKRAIFDFYLRRNSLEEARKWVSDDWQLPAELDHSKSEVAKQMGHDISRLLHWCLQKGELEYGHRLVRKAMSKNPPKPVWDAIFVWAAGTGKGADEIGRMLTVMEKSNESIKRPDQWRLPDNATMNGLLEFATSKNDPYLAERFIALGREKGIEPDARTYQLQIEYRLKINDVDGALIAYKNLQAMDLASGEDIPTVNKLIVALCRGKRHDFDTVMSVAMDLSDRQATFEFETVSTLALLHLSRDELPDVIDLLKTHAHRYSSAQRDSIRDAILSFCLDPKTPTSRSWDAYTVIRQSFDETSRSQRTEMIKNSFKRERPDMAVRIFNDMRRHSRSDTIPTVDTYVASFLGSAKLHDLDSLEVIHNQLKLDYNIDVTTYLNNALILAYTACGEARKALGFWSDIAASKEGPTYNSIHIALRACEKAPFGDIRAKEIWEKLRRMNVDLDQTMWASYVAALAGNGDNELAITTVEQAEANHELEVDAFLIGSLCAGANTAAKQEEIEEWARQRYPDIWTELEKLGSEIEEEEGRRLFKIDRSLAP